MKVQAFAALAKSKPLEAFEYEPQPLAPHEVEVKISHCGVCHSDLHLLNNDWGMSRYPLVPGHEIIGTLHQVGSAVTQLKPGQRVGIGWQADSCGECEWCARGEENLCARAGPTCVGRYGGFAQSIRVNSHFAIPVPDALASEGAAPLLCGGITVYSPLRAHQLGPQHRVGVIGIGGLGHMALQFARAFGCEVTAFSTSADKEAEARRLGAHHFVATKSPEGLKRVAGSFDFILSTVNADLPWLDYVLALRPYGTLCFVGAPPSNLSVPVFPLLATNKRIVGSNTGNTAGLREMLQVAARHGVKAQTERFKLDQANHALARVARNEVRYRAVLEV
ncbi:NAD(P)-dependent alcohol dehydrogenase [Hyalangium sp.]|uniref:NAD(P)-dependent alcohol dehydrogenase n=1 Tax=Hyalangium sp. TaxID=2028555 RepID=UPI002D614274|nr:NAD(P)-dependent alcohol dehydrogenase [Hyalangium sp.]HYH96957.1 NAD(P)-dependent alcohol dehydrogenase [Hyalangium sp.]